MVGTCRLCGINGELRESHRIPKFVFRWLKETSPGAIRHAENVNVRVQDGWKNHFLCAACEARFSRWERDFAKHVFRPYHDREREPKAALQYGDWCLRFCVSVSWRILKYALETGEVPELSSKQRTAAEAAVKTWEQHLLGQREHPGVFEQHIFPLDTLESGPSALMSPFLNRYFLRAVQEDVIAGREELLTFAKLGRLIIIGFVIRTTKWKGCKIHVREGWLAPQELHLPYAMGLYLKEQADLCGRAFASMTDRQKEIAQQGTAKAIDEEMEMYRAMAYDVWHSGEDAFWITRHRT